MAQYRYDPYTGQPLQNNRPWMENGYPQRNAPQQTAQNPSTGQTGQPGVIFRPVASYDEAKAVPTDFTGALTIMPDWAHGYIYAKALGDDGNPLFRAYRYEPPAAAPAPQIAPAVTYASLETVERMQEEIRNIRAELEAVKTPDKDVSTEKAPGKGAKT